MSSLGHTQPGENRRSPAPWQRGIFAATNEIPALAPGRDRQPASGGLVQERQWREPPGQAAGGAPWRICAGRWRDDASDIREHFADGSEDFVTVAITLRPTDATLMVDGRCTHDGKAAAGTALMTPPGLPMKVQFRGPCDILHLFVPVTRLGAISREAGSTASLEMLGRGSPLDADPTIDRLAWLLVKAGEFEPVAADLYVDGIAVAIVARLLQASADNRTRRQGTGLVKWRLRRVQELVRARLDAPLGLTDLARCAGLSRMHFAAQFRAATGMSPHEYLVHTRIQRAQEILRTSDTPLVQVALAVGFQTQAHFTTVFRNILAETPGRWRQLHRS